MATPNLTVVSSPTTRAINAIDGAIEALEEVLEISPQREEAEPFLSLIRGSLDVLDAVRDERKRGDGALREISGIIHDVCPRELRVIIGDAASRHMGDFGPEGA